MKVTFKNIARLAAGLSLLLLASCSKQNQNEKIAAKGPAVLGASIGPRPSDPKAEIAQLKRYRGQTHFLNPLNIYGGCYRGECMREEEKAAAGDARAEQESDVFKIGKPGSKLVFLLNNFRGLQVVSFEDGPEKPKILGRVKATGNFPSDMYYVQNRDRLLVIEKYSYNNYDGGESNEGQSRLISYDVSNPNEPRMESVNELKGTVADSRIVGEVLYVATSAKGKGAVTSYSLKSTKLSVVQSYTLPHRISESNTINIQTIEKEGELSYYLVATLSQSEWSWWDRTNVIQVVDITDPNGKIKLVMSAAVKGLLRERTQTIIKNNTLIVTSNYFINEENRIARIAVETFRFPHNKSEVLTEKEAEFRRLYVERELQGKSGAERDALLEKLINDPKTGIKGRFVRSGDELRKIMPDSSVTVGDGNGLSANLQDVRYKDGYLYAFWVPANEIDPFDIFDISNPGEGVKYISRLHFDGWIERAIPISYEGRNFVLGLGRIVPVVDNENQRRRPQAMIFEIVTRGRKLQAVEMAQFTFEGSNIWTNFNDDDKTIEVHDSGNGAGEILFRASRYDRNEYNDGGQILNYDLNVITKNLDGKALTPGAFLAGGSTWVRRMFTNTEINRVNSFSDQYLATFSSGSRAAPGTLQPAHMLELARNLQGYAVLSAGAVTFGVQIISENSWATNAAQTILRVVPIGKADTEKPAVLSHLELNGNYLGHLVEQKTKDLIILTNAYINEKVEGEEQYKYRHLVYANRVQINSDGKISTLKEVSWDNAATAISARFAAFNDSLPIVQLKNGVVLAQANTAVKILNLGQDLSVQDLTLEQCATSGREEIEVQVIGEKLFLSTKDHLQSKDYEGLEFSQNWLAPLSMNENIATCGKELNIPGRAVLVTESGEILSDDVSVKDIVPISRSSSDGENETEVGHGAEEGRDDYVPPKFRFITQSSLISTKMKEDVAVLVDGTENINQNSKVKQYSDNELVRLVDSDSGTDKQIEFLQVDADGFINASVFEFSTDLKSSAALTSLVPHPTKAGIWLALVQDYSKAQVIQWSQTDRRPSVVEISVMNENLQKMKPARWVAVQGYGLWGYGQVYQPHFTAKELSFELPIGLVGIEQLFIKE